MNIFIYTNEQNNIDNRDFEVVETKGKGHPDNICDTLAEKISANYSKYCIYNYGCILRHMIDKLSILGGGSKVSFGNGEIIEPIKILINGRFTDRYKSETIDYMRIVETTIKEYLSNLFPLLDVNKNIKIIDNTHHNEGPGVVFNKDGTTNNYREKFFEVIDDKDIKRHNNDFRCNDTSTTVSYFPMSKLEKLVLDIEQTLNYKKTKKQFPWIGTDIKVMGIRKKNNIEITSCVPLVAKYVKDVEDYKEKINNVEVMIEKISERYFAKENIKVFLNTRDNYENNDLYLTAIGSAIESGDEGAVGRGNRSRGVIPFCRNFSMEASCGKNPVYHTGKLFTAIGDAISEQIYAKYKLENVVYCTSKMGDYIENPWNITIELNEDINDDVKKSIQNIVENNVKNHNEITKDIINGNRKLNSY